MKIAIITPFYPFRGGIAKFSEALCDELAEKHKLLIINFVMQYPKLIFPGKTQFEETKRIVLPNKRVLTPYNPFTFIPTAKKILNFNPDFLLIPYWIPFFSISDSCIIDYIKKRSNIKIALLVHNFEAHENWFLGKYFTEKLFHKADFIISLSDNVYHSLNLAFPKKSLIKGFHPVYDYLNKKKITSEFARSKFKILEKKVILFFGYIKNYKGLDILIKALQILVKKDENYHLLIVGEIYGNENKYNNLISELKLKSHITLINRFVDDNEIEYFFRASDLLALPYRSATQSGVLQLAAYFGIGAVATPVGNFKKFLNEYSIGCVAENISPEAFAQAIEKYYLMDQKDIFLNTLKIREKYTWKNLAELILEKIN
ncbi:MAG: glycosyltransferase [Candidatus Cloacimonetes bacterium]|nr:glycosyltransferase [Candidatus Cloacimonadota bacterium]